MGTTRSPESSAGSPLFFGRTPRGVYLLVSFVCVATVLATFSAVTPWYTESGSIPEATIHTTFTEGFTPGPGGYIASCAKFLTANYSDCGSIGTTYGAGNGTDLLAGLYLGLLFGIAGVAVLSFAGAAVIVSCAVGKVRVRRAQSLVATFALAALVVGAVTACAMPALQEAALDQSGFCVGFQSGQTPCNSLFGHTNGSDCTNGTCAETNLSWHPDIGWYLLLGSLAFLFGTYLWGRRQPLGAPCPTCGERNRFHGRYCDSCGNPLPSVRSEKLRVPRL
jgi:hypothetical protein